MTWCTHQSIFFEKQHFLWCPNAHFFDWNVDYDCCPQMKPMSTNPRNVKVIGCKAIVSSSYRWPICHVRSRELNFCDSWPWNATRNGSLGTATHLLHLDESSSLLLVGHVQQVRGCGVSLLCNQESVHYIIFMFDQYSNTVKSRVLTRLV